ncbi:MAG: hypothetical protein OIF40_03430 [Mangrovicoccus sp.]|nr:hypothetical protein [Mangrovicoccus sp.]
MKSQLAPWIAAGLLGLGAALPAFGEAPEITQVSAKETGGTWRFDVTIAHPDTGWGHYADGWEVLSPDGTRLGYRELAHPHVNEQPFTRSLSGVEIPADLTEVEIRARCNETGWSETRFRLALPGR